MGSRASTAHGILSGLFTDHAPACRPSRQVYRLAGRVGSDRRPSGTVRFGSGGLTERFSARVRIPRVGSSRGSDHRVESGGLTGRLGSGQDALMSYGLGEIGWDRRVGSGGLMGRFGSGSHCTHGAMRFTLYFVYRRKRFWFCPCIRFWVGHSAVDVRCAPKTLITVSCV